MNKYRIYCTTENKWEYVTSLTEPSECPTDSNHTIDSNSITVVETGIIDSTAEITDSTEQTIDSTYDHKEKDGHAYYRKKRAQLVKEIVLQNITEADADFIDVKLEKVSQKINTGDWKSAKKRLLETVVEGAYTQTLYDEYEAEIDAYILANY